jgi:hypothetical protein
MATNIYWTCKICGTQVPAERLACPHCEEHGVRSEEEPRYQEAREWEERRERRGRSRMKRALLYGIVAGLVSGAAVFLVPGNTEATGAFAGLACGAIIGHLFRVWAYDSGLNLVLEAQRALVAMDTEENTREIVELLKQAREAKDPPGEPTES